jgi:hypothetical protein
MDAEATCLTNTLFWRNKSLIPLEAKLLLVPLRKFECWADAFPQTSTDHYPSKGHRGEGFRTAS